LTASDRHDPFSLAGKVALVTGGSRGLGRAISQTLAAAGADLVLSSRDLDSCRSAAEEIAAETGRQVEPIACNVGHWNEVDALAEASFEAFGRVDVLVNNAGMSPLYDELTSITEALWDKVLAVNLKGPFRLAAIVGERMVASRRGGSIVNVGSIVAKHPTPDVVPYAAAKAGLSAITVALAHGFGPSVRVNCVAPGTFLTDVSKGWDMEAFSVRAKSFALQRGAQPCEITATVLYLASDASSYTTGAEIAVDGGYV
jgi:NAD(P)-dependent dehydrogenase (short-subunit alcohol dehydrogenase family)